MIPIRYVVGDATRPIGDGPKIIAHVCNDAGKWGAGFSGALSERWPAAEQDYRQWHSGLIKSPPFGLGNVSFTIAVRLTMVANMIAQRGVRSAANLIPIRYNALRSCLAELARLAADAGCSIHMPRIGCGLAGGTWDLVEPIIVDELSSKDIPVIIYDLPGVAG